VEVNPDELIAPEQVAAELHVKTGTLDTWRSQGRGPKFFKVGRNIFYRRADLAEWLGAQQRQPVAVQVRRTRVFTEEPRRPRGRPRREVVA
jgi:Helix-turn-helix domain